MEIRITMLGTSGSSPTKSRAMPGIALTYNGSIILFDCGEGTQMQMIKYGINFSKINAIFISHTHGDHIIGLAGLVRTMAMNRRSADLEIFVPVGYERVIKALISFDKALMTYRINIHGIRSGIVYRTREFSVSAFPTNHTISSCGYVFRENDRRRFIVEKAERLGIKGRMHSVLQERGWIRIKKRKITLDSVTTVQKSKIVVYATDTRPSKSTVLASMGADLLIHESSYSEGESNLAKERKHSTSGEAAAIAKAAKAKRLVLTHISARHSSVERLEKEAKAVFKNSNVAEDGDIIIV